MFLVFSASYDSSATRWILCTKDKREDKLKDKIKFQARRCDFNQEQLVNLLHKAAASNSKIQKVSAYYIIF